MGMTLTEKIIARHAGVSSVKAGEILDIAVDKVLVNDVTGPIALERMAEMGYEEVFDKDRVVFIMDHFTPNSNVNAAHHCKICRDYARKYQIPNFYESVGIEHVVMQENGLAWPGEVVIGADSHSCTHGAIGAFATGMGSTDISVAMATGSIWVKVPPTIKVTVSGKADFPVCGKDIALSIVKELGTDGATYKALEIGGEAIGALPMADRFSISNMAIEAGAKCGIIGFDEITEQYFSEIDAVELAERAKAGLLSEKSDADAVFEKEIKIDAGKLSPQVALPDSPDNVCDVDKVNEKVDQVFIGSCTNGRIDDLRIAAELLKGRKVHPGVRLIVTPASAGVFMQAESEGLLRIFMEAGAIIGTPSCGPCFGGHSGILAENETCFSTTNRNFKGRMGDQSSRLFLGSPAVAAVTALNGRISDPREFING